jgi:hypothetical protein
MVNVQILIFGNSNSELFSNPPLVESNVHHFYNASRACIIEMYQRFTRALGVQGTIPPLFAAAISGYACIVRVLIEAGAEVDVLCTGTNNVRADMLFPVSCLPEIDRIIFFWGYIMGEGKAESL